MIFDHKHPLTLLAEWESHGPGRWGEGVAIDYTILLRRIEELEAGIKSAYVELPTISPDVVNRIPVKTAEHNGSGTISKPVFAAGGHDPCPLNSLIGAVMAWAADKGILAHSTAQAQLLKTMSELGELADATIKQRPADVIDGLGDVLVTLIIYAKLQKVTIHECLSSAYDQIKDRRGRMVPGGAFVKEGDE